jgi:NAD(P)-dependent dehydrogenase (short-subunit alcohol dehydrogenase family)
MAVLDGRVALVTGGARGQGRAHAVALAAEGAHVVVADIVEQIPSVAYPMATRAELDATVAAIRDGGGAATAAVLDVRSSEAVGRLVDGIVAEHGRVDILVANAGIMGLRRIVDIGDAMWRDVLDTNLSGVFYCIRAVLPYMTRQRYGRIVAISSGAGRAGMAELGHYAASKWGLIGLVKTAALEAATVGVTANVVCPTTVATPMVFNPATLSHFIPDIEAPTVEDARARFESMTPMRRAWLEPQDVTRAVMYLVTDPGCTSGTVVEVNLATSASRT